MSKSTASKVINFVPKYFLIISLNVIWAVVTIAKILPKLLFRAAVLIAFWSIFITVAPPLAKWSLAFQITFKIIAFISMLSLFIPFEKIFVRTQESGSKENKSSMNNSYIDSDDDFVTNPATGLPMMNGWCGLDVAGNPYGSS